MLLIAAPASAQTPSFGGLSQNSDEPIDIESDVLVVHDSKKYATFKGNVKAVQGTTTLLARELDVHYVGGREKLTGAGTTTASNEVASTSDAGTVSTTVKRDDGTQITKIEAKGEVVITSEDDQTTTSDWALYDVPTQMVTVGGNVVLMQGQNVLKGDRLIIDLKTGESRFENTGNTATGGRIRALFMPKDSPAAAAPPADGEPQAAPEPNAAAPRAEPPAESAAPLQLMPEHR
ncbi:MAG: LptA/OstA family protein [Methyloceanibacter sp.]